MTDLILWKQHRYLFLFEVVDLVLKRDWASLMCPSAVPLQQNDIKRVKQEEREKQMNELLMLYLLF